MTSWTTSPWRRARSTPNRSDEAAGAHFILMGRSIRTPMKFLLLALLILPPAVAQAASPRAPSAEKRYYAARGAYVAKIEAISAAGNVDGEASKLHDRATDALAKLMAPTIGPVAIKGFPAKPTTSLDSLYKGDFGFGLLDGLVYSSADTKTRIVVSTQALFRRWLREHKDWWGSKSANAPQASGAALKSEVFYTQALVTDSAIQKYLELPVAKPVGARFAFAMLVARTQVLG